jgi:hypothetical protein
MYGLVTTVASNWGLASSYACVVHITCRPPPLPTNTQPLNHNVLQVGVLEEADSVQQGPAASPAGRPQPLLSNLTAHTGYTGNSGGTVATPECMHTAARLSDGVTAP